MRFDTVRLSSLCHAVVVGTGRLAGQGMKVPAMPRASQPALLALVIAFDRTFTERPALVRACIGKRGILAVEMHQCNARASGLDGPDLLLLHLADVGDPVPHSFHALGGIEFVSRDLLVAAIA